VPNAQPLDHLYHQLDPGGCRLLNPPERIWLFGGKGEFRMGSTKTCESLRESFWRQSLALTFSPSRTWPGLLDIPENHSGWWAFSGYDDLLTFERDACHLARAIILFPESPGSLAELGALAVDDSIVDRLLVVVQERYLRPNYRESFLNLGPLKRVQARQHQCVIRAETTTDLTSDDFENIIEFVDARLPLDPEKQKLRVVNPMHKLLLIADLVDLLLIARPRELQAVLNFFRVEISIPELERVAKLLEFFGLVRIDNWGLELFFRRPEHQSRTWVDYTSRDGQPTFDRSRFKVDRKALIATDRRQMAVYGRSV